MLLRRAVGSVIGRATLAAAMVLALAPAAGAEERAPTPVDPDRPSVSTSARTVPPGAVQVETGLAYEHERVAAAPADRRLSVEAALRVGVAPWLEARVEGEPVVRLRGEEADTGPGDVTLSVKWRVLDGGGAVPAVALLPFVTLPAAREPIGSGQVDAGLRVLLSFELPAQLSLDVNAGGAAIGQPHSDGYLAQAVASAALSRALGERLSAFAEVFFASHDRRGGHDSLGADAGLAFFLTPRVALDVAILTTLAGPGPEYALRAGVSVRFGR